MLIHCRSADTGDHLLSKSKHSLSEDIMKTKILAAALALSFSSLASAVYVEVSYETYDATPNNTAYGSVGSGNVGANSLIASPILASAANTTPYFVHFAIQAPVAPSGYHITGINWAVAGNLFNGGYIQFDGNGGSVDHIVSYTNVTIGSDWDFSPSAPSPVLGSFAVQGLNAITDPTTVAGNSSHYFTSDGTATGSAATSTFSGSYNTAASVLDIYAYFSATTDETTFAQYTSYMQNFGNITASADVQLAPDQVPEPVSSLLVGAGLLGMGTLRRRARKAA